MIAIASCAESAAPPKTSETVQRNDLKKPKNNKAAKVPKPEPAQKMTEAESITALLKSKEPHPEKWSKKLAYPALLEFYGHLKPEEYKLSVEFFLEDHNSQQETHHSIANDLLVGHQIKGFMDHVFGSEEFITTEVLRKSLEHDSVSHWMDNLTPEEHKEYEEYIPTKNTIYHDDMYLEDF